MPRPLIRPGHAVRLAAQFLGTGDKEDRDAAGVTQVEPTGALAAPCHVGGGGGPSASKAHLRFVPVPQSEVSRAGGFARGLGHE
ncbi:hypothetical protein HEK616_84760 (plasmid) [Streptomyces nigrescens]|uniref:Uncharacterized protein n=1 Tax=Streptomyces nigrescens TaxID=1920 RepID=A0ABM8A8U8_STRNI|nr:hypothetical protein HEK616_84760 [Streptomyces nigrescens]